MMALLYCRRELAEQIHASDRAAAIAEAAKCLRGLSWDERKSWTLVVVDGKEVQRVFGPKI